MLSASAADYSITIKNLVYPRPGAAQQGNITYSGNFDCELLGWQWLNYYGDMATADPDSFKNFMFSMEEDYYGTKLTELKTFTDTEEI